MKKLIYSLSILAMLSCSHDFSTITFQEQQKAKFQTEFVKTYGNVADNHDWGFSSSTTRACVEATGGVGWTGYQTPNPITDEERAAVLAEFQKVREGAENTVEFNYETYFAQHVYTGTTEYTAADGNTKKTPSQAMNEFMCWNYNTNAFEHVNGFNNATCKDKINDANLMENMGTGDRLNDQFCFSNANDGRMYHGSYIILEINGYYYLGFDFWATYPEGQESNLNMKIDRDWVFDDWIIKLVPAQFDLTGGKRIIAEDLGSVGDFDYNDVVFDAVIKNEYLQAPYYSNMMVAYITVQAAGGTLPLTVGDKEVHELFGVDTNVMVNTGQVSKAPVSFKYVMGDADWNADLVAKLKDIPVCVYANGEVINLEVNPGAAPEKIAVPLDFVWTYERERIESKYPRFTEYVKNPSIDWWN